MDVCTGALIDEVTALISTTHPQLCQQSLPLETFYVPQQCNHRQLFYIFESWQKTFAESITMVGTVRAHRREIPSEI